MHHCQIVIPDWNFFEGLFSDLILRRFLKMEKTILPPVTLELVCESFADYVPWKDDVPEIEVG